MDEETKLILKALEYLLWVHQPRSDKSEDIRNKLQVDIHLILNPIISPSLPSKTKDALSEPCNYCGKIEKEHYDGGFCYKGVDGQGSSADWKKFAKGRSSE